MKPRIQRIQVSKLNNPFLSPQAVCFRRHVHTNRPWQAPVSVTSQIPISHDSSQQKSNSSNLSCLPTSSIIRTYFITGISSNTALRQACFALLRKMLDSKSIFLNPEKNKALRWLFKRTFYAQFCAGENKAEVQKTVEKLKTMGYTGVILEYALEVLETDKPSAGATGMEIETWRVGMRETVEVASPGDFIGLKWSGLGRQALANILDNKPPTPEMQKVIHEVCDLAAAKGVLFLPGAETEDMNIGIDSWTLDLMRRYNKEKAFMYNTYQVCLKSTPGKLAQHLAIAQKEGFIPGIKVVRGAYMAMEPAGACCDCKDETDKMYDGVIDALLKRKYNDILRPAPGSEGKQIPETAVMLATHNHPSIRKALDIRKEQSLKGAPLVECSYAQLQGMADEISCELVQVSKAAAAQGEDGKVAIDKPRAFKCATWGTLEQCMNFLLRRASENQDAAGRTADTRKAMGRELMRRWKAGVGFA